ncbi:hypothetical protein [Saccharopolyspora pogona]|uniref:hypothetical protein n=1 Tax=Saccharopolyspora pogona TaxID=333966 RepID=UPI001683BDA1|nr:hypothetical protein [Saccharopolyspora pogona]
MTRWLEGIPVRDGTRAVGVSNLSWTPDRIEEVIPATRHQLAQPHRSLLNSGQSSR